MCTAATYKTRDFYFGRTLDYEFSYGDQITITPRNYPFHFRHAGVIDTHFAIIGMAHVAENYPLYYDAINEKGLGMAGLNFVGNAAYADVKPGLDNIAQFEFIPWILSQCASVAEVRTLLARMNLVNTPFTGTAPLDHLRQGGIHHRGIHVRRASYLRQSGGCPHQQSTISTADVPVKQLHASVAKTACQYFC